MVSKASDDLPDPESPVNTTSLSRGIVSVTFFRLCSRAPRIVMWSIGMGPWLFLLSRDCKRPARRRDKPSVLAFDPAFGHGGPAPAMDDLPLCAQVLADLRGVDEVELEVDAHRAGDARLQRSQRAAHRAVGESADDTAVHETGVIGHVPCGRHLHQGRSIPDVHELEAKPAPGPRGS